jgi:hypothetical protein
MPDIVSKQVISIDKFREELSDGGQAPTGTRVYKVSNISTLELSLIKAVDGLPKIGSSWSSDFSTLYAISRRAEWLTVPRDGESLGVAKVTVSYGIDQMVSLSEQASPRRPGDLWSTYKTGSISQVLMYGKDIFTNSRYVNSPINNGQGVQVDIGIAVVTVSKAYKEDVHIPVGNYLTKMRPPKINQFPLEIPSLWGKRNKLSFDKGELLYKGHTIEAQNGLVIVTHEMWGSDDWTLTWTVENDEGRPIASSFCNIYDYADFGDLW